LQQVPPSPPPPRSGYPALAHPGQAGRNPWGLASLLLAVVPIALFILAAYLAPSLGTAEIVLVGALFLAEVVAVVTGIVGIVRSGRAGRGMAVAIVGLILGSLAAIPGFFILLIALETGIFAPRS
jgi:hypothetical protein